MNSKAISVSNLIRGIEFNREYLLSIILSLLNSGRSDIIHCIEASLGTVEIMINLVIISVDQHCFNCVYPEFDI